MMICSRLRPVACCAIAALAAGLSGCSVHPLPQDVSYASTVQIVRRIRCEAQEGLREALRKAAADSPRKKQHVEKIVKATTIGFEFQFVMGEDNKAADGQLVFRRKDLEGEGFTLTLVGNLNESHGESARTRKTKRIFRVVDDLGELDGAWCGQRTKSVGPNPIYPVTGSTGMAEVVRSYIELETLTDLQSVSTTRVAGKTEIVTFSDKLDFTTEFVFGVLPELEFQTAVGILKLTKASIAGSVLRHDFHSVNVVLARDDGADLDLPDERPSAALARRKVPAVGPRTPAVDKGRAVIDDVRDKSLQKFLTQRAAVARNRVVIELDRRRLVAEDKAVAERVLAVPLP
jgi:hypothetical protein